MKANHRVLVVSLGLISFSLTGHAESLQVYDFGGPRPCGCDDDCAGAPGPYCHLDWYSGDRFCSHLQPGKPCHDQGPGFDRGTRDTGPPVKLDRGYEGIDPWPMPDFGPPRGDDRYLDDYHPTTGADGGVGGYEDEDLAQRGGCSLVRGDAAPDLGFLLLLLWVAARWPRRGPGRRPAAR